MLIFDTYFFSASGKKCSKYICTHSTDQASTEQYGPNYNIQNSYVTAANQYGPNFANTYATNNKAGNVLTSSVAPYY